MAKMAMVIDLNRCVGCMSCIVACKATNNVEIGKYWTWVERVGPTGKFPDNEMYFLPKLCYHCETPECITVCPTGATYKRPDGIVIVDSAKCIGCEECIHACPYGSRILNSEHEVAEKCTLCFQLLDRGEQPACAVNCPGDVRIVTDLDDPTSRGSLLLKDAGKGNIYKMKDDVGIKPVGCFILRKLKWQEGYE